MIPEQRLNSLSYFYITLGAIFAVVVGIGVVGSYFVLQEKNLTDKIYPYVFVDDIPLGYQTKTEAQKVFNNTNNHLRDLQITVLYQNEAIATLSGKTNKIALDDDEIIDRAYLIGRTPHMPSRLLQKISTIFKLQAFNFETRVIYDTGSVQDLISGWEEQYNKPAKNALFSFNDGKVTTFREHEYGLGIESDQFLKDLDKVLQKHKNNALSSTESLVLTSKVVKPEITLSEANDFGIEELIGEGVSDYTHSIPERIYNLSLAASKFNGVLIPKGKDISFNDIVGDISSSTGYKPAYIIKNGRTVLGDGGGVCQASTTLFRAALNTGLPVLERTAHAYRVQYYENDAKPGLDATVFGPTVDLKIKNDTPGAILIQTYTEEESNLLHFKFYGKKDGRTAEISPIRVYDQSPAPPPLYQDDFTLKKGVVKQVDFASPGAKSQFTFKIHYKDKDTYEQTFTSVYRPWQAVFLVGQAD